MRAAWLSVPLLALVASVAEAAETGDIRGKVVDQDGLPIPNASVTLSGPSISGEVKTTTDAEGRFTILQVPPGQHQLDVSMGGFKSTDVTVTVRLDESAFVPVTLASVGTTVEVVVTTTLPVIDTTRSALSTELTSDQLANLPTGRSYQDAVNMVPGVYGRIDTETGGTGTGNPSVRGEGAYGNNYFLDGISTRDPATKTFGTKVDFDAIDSIQVYTDGAPAEFGQFTGMLVDVDTKDGGDVVKGTAADYVNFTATGGTYLILDTDKGKEVPTPKQKFFNDEFAATLGGPFVKEKLWYFASIDFDYDNTTQEGVDYPSKTTAPQGFAKITWFATPDLSFSYEFAGDTLNATNSDASPLIDQSATSDQKDWSMTHIVTTRYRPDALGEVELKLSTSYSRIDVVPHSGEEDVPRILNVETSQYSNNGDSFDYNLRNRTGGSLKITRLAKGFAGSHKFKIGSELFRLYESRELVYTGPGDGKEYFAAPESGYPCTAPDFDDCYGYTEFSQTKPVFHTALTTGSFVQDDWQPVDPLTFNVGVRLDTESLYNTDHEHLITNWMPAPRLGGVWDVTGDSKTKISANYGWYFDLNGNDFAAWSDSRSLYSYTEVFADGFTYTQDPETSPSVFCTDDSLKQYYDSVPSDYADSVRSQINDICGNGLKPYHSEKAVVAVEREVVPLLAVGLRGIISRTENIPEDIDLDGSTYVIGNVAAKSRDYKALELTVERKFDDVWSALVSWTISESKGTTPGQFEEATGSNFGSAGNDVGVYLDDINSLQTLANKYDNGRADGYAGLGTIYDDAGYYGYLPYHSFHDVKVNTFYTFPEHTTVGLVYEFDSGHAWQERGWVPAYADYNAFPEGRGSRFMPPVNYIDARVAQAVKFKDDRSVELAADVFNVPDLQTPITYYENSDEPFGNTTFGKVLFRQTPRAVRLSLKGTF